jgi:hypothetical protein
VNAGFEDFCEKFHDRTSEFGFPSLRETLYQSTGLVSAEYVAAQKVSRKGAKLAKRINEGLGMM